ncbi:hypothetical protein [Mycobacterium malmoense]|uniref:hypothetical protein n=1 Tax=Mycobacterium malmoense TaxID=1780 RepID=UPI00114D4A20|nr:hypothetical protein [Mycobacterium malmoense]
MGLVLEMDPEPYDQLVRLYESNPTLAARVDEWLDRIEVDPTDPAVRRRLIRPGSVWAITVPESVQDYLILWDLDGDTPVIRYLGPDVLTGS